MAPNEEAFLGYVSSDSGRGQVAVVKIKPLRLQIHLTASPEIDKEKPKAYPEKVSSEKLLRAKDLAVEAV